MHPETALSKLYNRHCMYFKSFLDTIRCDNSMSKKLANAWQF